MYKNIEEAMIALSVWKRHLRKTVKPLAKDIVYKPTFHADVYRESAMYRFIELMESAYSLYKSNLLVGGIVVVRAAQETLAVIWYVNTKLKYLSETKDVKHFSERVRSLTVGWSKEDDDLPKMLNVMTCIKSVDKEMEGKFSRHYDMLSEYSHPNYSGTYGSYANSNHETLEVNFDQYQKSEKALSNCLEDSIILFVSYLDVVQETYEKVINEALDVCRELHEKGELKGQLCY